MARTFIATTRSRSAQTHDLTRSGSPIWSRASCARPAARRAPTCGLTFIGLSHPSRRWAIAEPFGAHLRPTRIIRARMPVPKLLAVGDKLLGAPFLKSDEHLARG